MKIQVEIPAEKLDAAVKNLKKELQKALTRIKVLEVERDRAISELKSIQQMRNDFKDVCNRYADQQDWGP